jgi:hypothetical protein
LPKRLPEAALQNLLLLSHNMQVKIIDGAFSNPDEV